MRHSSEHCVYHRRMTEPATSSAIQVVDHGRDWPPRLGSLGYQHRGDLGIADREAFLAPRNQPAHHLYLCVENSLALKNHLAVRDYLRTTCRTRWLIPL